MWVHLAREGSGDVVSGYLLFLLFLGDWIWNEYHQKNSKTVEF